MRPFLIGSFTAASRSGPGISLIPSNDKLTDTSCSYPPMDYTPFIRCSTALKHSFSIYVAAHFVLGTDSMNIKLERWLEQIAAVAP